MTLFTQLLVFTFCLIPLFKHQFIWFCILQRIFVFHLHAYVCDFVSHVLGYLVILKRVLWLLRSYLFTEKLIIIAMVSKPYTMAPPPPA